MQSAILEPIVALAAWTMVMWVWMYATRLPAMAKIEGLDTKNMIGGIGADLDKVIPGKVQWVAHNYNHLHEQPVIFYAVALTLAFIGQGDGINAYLAWGYVILRVVHSLIQVLWNRVMFRFLVFLLSGLVLAALTLHASIAVF